MREENGATPQNSADAGPDTDEASEQTRLRGWLAEVANAAAADAGAPILLLGEYLDSTEADLPSAAVVAMLREFDISESSARAALSRLTRRGLIATRGTRRPPVYHLTSQAIARHFDPVRSTAA